MNQRLILLNRSIILGTFVCLSFILVGCTPSYSGGCLHAHIDSHARNVLEASISSFEKLNIRIIEKSMYISEYVVIGKTRDEQTIKIVLKGAFLDPNSTNLRICVEIVGNEALSRTIYKQILEDLDS